MQIYLQVSLTYLYYFVHTSSPILESTYYKQSHICKTFNPLFVSGLKICNIICQPKFFNIVNPKLTQQVKILYFTFCKKIFFKNMAKLCAMEANEWH